MSGVTKSCLGLCCCIFKFLSLLPSVFFSPVLRNIAAVGVVVSSDINCPCFGCDADTYLLLTVLVTTSSWQPC